MELRDIVMKLIGPVMPIGDSREDKIRLVNMKKLIDLTDSLLCEISVVSRCASREEASMKAIGVYARDFVQGLKNT